MQNSAITSSAPPTTDPATLRRVIFAASLRALATSLGVVTIPSGKGKQDARPSAG
jgi:hypothetical protein